MNYFVKKLMKKDYMEATEVELKELISLMEREIIPNWARVKEACERADIRLCPYGGEGEKFGPLMDNYSYFTDNGSFEKCVGSDLHTSANLFGFEEKDGRINWISSEKFEDVQTEVSVKFQTLQLFLENFHAYKEIQLKRISAKMSKRYA